MENREFTIDHDGIALHAKLDFPAVPSTDGKYPLVIIEHGYTGHMEERHITALQRAVNEAGFAALRIELYGHGSSGGAFRDHTILKWVSEMMTVIDYAKALPFVTSLHLAGHSQGGLTAMLVGSMKRDVLDTLVPMSPAIVIRDAAKEGCFFDNPFDPEHIPDELHLIGGRVLAGNYFRAAQILPVETAIANYHGPVCIVHGDADELVPVQYAYDAAAAYENAELHIIPGDTHCYDYKLDEVNAIVVDFLKRHA